MTRLCVARFARPVVVALSVWALAFLAGVIPVAACSIDGIASLKLNNIYATKNQAAPAGSNLATWAPFSLGDASPRVTLHLAEDLAKLRGVLPAASLQHPFTWKFGDGTSAVGQSVSHEYAQSGHFKLEVRYYLTSTRQWVLFDSAQLKVVQPVVVSLAPVHNSNSSSGGTNVLVVGLAGVAGLACVGAIAWQLRGMRSVR